MPDVGGGQRGASLMPSPTIATLAPAGAARSAAHHVRPCRRAAPRRARRRCRAAAATACALPRLSPLSSTRAHAQRVQRGDRRRGAGLERVAEGQQRRAARARRRRCSSASQDTRAAVAPAARCGARRQRRRCRRRARASSGCCPAAATRPSTRAVDAAARRRRCTSLRPAARRRPRARASEHRARQRVFAAAPAARPQSPAGVALVAAAGDRMQRHQPGRPSVSVPVLSKATTRTACASSSASASLIRMPWRAATPVPTMIAVGVARPSAQGQAITSTATALQHGLRPVAAGQAPAEQGEQRDGQHHRHEDRADAVDQALDRRLPGLRRFDQPHDARQRGLGADGRGAQHAAGPRR